MKNRGALALLVLGAIYIMSSLAKLTRGERNNNPGNLKDFGIDWQGRIGSDGPFIVFDSPHNGIRALARDLRTDYIRDGQNTVRSLISEFAPGSENDTESYIRSVAGRMSVAPDEVLALPGQLQPLVTAIIIHENGRNRYAPETILGAVHDAWTS